MGGCSIHSSERSLIVAATLNFSGICLSPFEFFDGSVEKDMLSHIFAKLMVRKQLGPPFVWKVGKIDQKMQKERYTPIYRKEAGVKDGKLMTQEEFSQAWDLEFEANKKKAGIDPSADQIKHAKLFDTLAYEAFISFSCLSKAQKQEALDWTKIKTLDANLYRAFLEEWHSQSYLSTEQKMKMVVRCLKKSGLDVLFLQEADIKSQQLWRKLLPQEYEFFCKKGSDSAIIYAKEVFPHDRSTTPFNQRYQKKISWNDDTVFFKSGQYVLVSVHLSSKADKHKVQAKEMLDSIAKIRLQMPGLNFIMGCDNNHFVVPPQGIQSIPTSQDEFTTAKKRTTIQLQTSKANMIVLETKDQILSNLQLQKRFIGLLDGKELKTKQYLPSQEHPFDHYIVCADISTP